MGQASGLDPGRPFPCLSGSLSHPLCASVAGSARQVARSAGGSRHVTTMFACLGPPTRRVNIQLPLDPGVAAGSKCGNRDISQLLRYRLCASSSHVSRGFLISVSRRRNLSSQMGCNPVSLSPQALLHRLWEDLRSKKLCGALVGWDLKCVADGGRCSAQG